MLKFPYILSLVAFGRLSLSQTADESLMTGYLVSNEWMAEEPSVCDKTLCCCFNSGVNIYLKNGELYVNGTVEGIECVSSVEEDNLNIPSTYIFSQEFFGIDSYQFTLAGGGYNGTNGFVLIAQPYKTIDPPCGFTLFRMTDELLPVAPTPTSTAVPTPSDEDVLSPYLGTWDVEATCAQNSRCCCYDGPVSVTLAPGGAPEFYINGTVTTGCEVNTATLQDNFHWPLAGTPESSTTKASGMLRAENDYNITLAYNASTSNYTLNFADLNDPQCSMDFVRASAATSLAVGFVVVCSTLLSMLF
jgi:hypothetical protein